MLNCICVLSSVEDDNIVSFNCKVLMRQNCCLLAVLNALNLEVGLIENKNKNFCIFTQIKVS